MMSHGNNQPFPSQDGSLPSTVQRKRVRTWSPKVRSGCLTCKKRRVKCDEAKPVCVRCSSKGYKCDGYKDIQESLGSKPTFTVVLNPSQSFQGTEQEKRAFDHFYQRTVQDLAGNFDSDFWTHLILRAVQVEPAVRHAALAVGSLHEYYSSSQRNTVNDSCDPESLPWFSSEQYGKAMHLIAHPKRRTSDQSLDVILTVCILFICLESIRGNLGIALVHVKSGLKILDELRLLDHASHSAHSTHSDTRLIPTDMLETLFTRLDIQATGLVDASPEGPTRMHSTPPQPLPAPFVFKTLEDARAAMLKRFCFLQYSIRDLVMEPDFVEKLPRSDAARQVSRFQKDFLQYLDDWQVAKCSCLELANPDRRTLIASKILDLHRDLYTTTTLRFSGACVREGVTDMLRPEEVLTDDPQRFARMVATAEEIHELELAGAKTAQGKSIQRLPAIAFDLGITEPMLFTIMTCEDQSLRNRAMQLLEASPVLDGLWGSTTAAKMARAFIDDDAGEQAESRSPDVVDNITASKLQSIEIEFHMDQSATLNYYQTDGSILSKRISTRVKT